RAVLCRGILDARLELVVLVGQGELGALPVHCLGDAVGDRALAGDAGDERALALQESHGVVPLSWSGRMAQGASLLAANASGATLGASTRCTPWPRWILPPAKAGLSLRTSAASRPVSRAQASRLRASSGSSTTSSTGTSRSSACSHCSRSSPPASSRHDSACILRT